VDGEASLDVHRWGVGGVCDLPATGHSEMLCYESQHDFPTTTCASGGCWVLLVGIVLLLLAHIPSVLSAHTLDFWSMVLQLTVLAFISPLATSADEVVIAATGLFMGVCIPATAFTTRSTVLLFCHAAFLFNAVVRVIIDKEEFKIASQCSVMKLGRDLNIFSKFYSVLAKKRSTNRLSMIKYDQPSH